MGGLQGKIKNEAWSCLQCRTVNSGAERFCTKCGVLRPGHVCRVKRPEWEYLEKIGQSRNAEKLYEITLVLPQTFWKAYGKTLRVSLRGYYRAWDVEGELSRYLPMSEDIGSGRYAEHRRYLYLIEDWPRTRPNGGLYFDGDSAFLCEIPNRVFHVTAERMDAPVTLYGCPGADGLCSGHLSAKRRTEVVVYE